MILLFGKGKKTTDRGFCVMKKSMIEPGIRFVPRKRVGEFTNGLLSPRTMANLDSAGVGPEGRVRVGNQICYPVDEFLKWLEQRTEKVE